MMVVSNENGLEKGVEFIDFLQCHNVKRGKRMTTTAVVAVVVAIASLDGDSTPEHRFQQSPFPDPIEIQNDVGTEKGGESPVGCRSRSIVLVRDGRKWRGNERGRSGRQSFGEGVELGYGEGGFGGRSGGGGGGGGVAMGVAARRVFFDLTMGGMIGSGRLVRLEYPVTWIQGCCRRGVTMVVVMVRRRGLCENQNLVSYATNGWMECL
mmetsp:Transcript_4218/g.9509  ORF Transcript_4218/g.9509 Transcript_4218/m.9509 type:complete len:209 (+) Transcript_4218:1186-1812(+)